MYQFFESLFSTIVLRCWSK